MNKDNKQQPIIHLGEGSLDTSHGFHKAEKLSNGGATAVSHEVEVQPISEEDQNAA